MRNCIFNSCKSKHPQTARWLPYEIAQLSKKAGEETALFRWVIPTLEGSFLFPPVCCQTHAFYMSCLLICDRRCNLWSGCCLYPAQSSSWHLTQSFKRTSFIPSSDQLIGDGGIMRPVAALVVFPFLCVFCLVAVLVWGYIPWIPRWWVKHSAFRYWC